MVRQQTGKSRKQKWTIKQLHGGRSVGSQPVGHQYVRRKALLLEQSAHELRSCLGVASPLHEKIESLAFVIDRAPEPEPSAADQNRHFVEVPLRGWPWTSASKSFANNGPNFNTRRLTVS
jgi:hypothetical protein